MDLVGVLFCLLPILVESWLFDGCTAMVVYACTTKLSKVNRVGQGLGRIEED